MSFQHLSIDFYKMQLWKVTIRTRLFYIIKKYFISKACVSCNPLKNIVLAINLPWLHVLRMMNPVYLVKARY